MKTSKNTKNTKNYKVRCTGYNNLERYFTKGKVYEVKDNAITNDNGYTYGGSFESRNIIDWLKRWYNFEVVEDQVEYKIGDRVIIEEGNLDGIMGEPLAGKTGVITGIDHNYNYKYRVLPDGRDYGAGGIWCHVKCHANEKEKIVITHDGKTTTATLYRGDTKFVGTARCCPEDTFDFMFGSQLAVERMFEEVERHDKAHNEEECEWRVVDRPAKKGDYIRLTHTSFTFDEVGDILKVHDEVHDVYGHNVSVAVLAKDHPNPKALRTVHGDNVWHYTASEYEVVEKVYKPKFRKGEFVKVIGGDYHYFPIGQIVEVVEPYTKDGFITCEGFCHNVKMICKQWLCADEIAPLE